MSKLDELIKELCPDGVEYKPLEKCCNILDRQRKPVTKSAREIGKYPYYGANGIQDYVSDYIFDGTFVLVGEDGSVITKNGNPVVTWAQGKIWVNNHAHIVEETEGVLLRYLYHYIQMVDVTPLIHGNIPKLTGGDFKAIPIPLPPLAVQEEIVSILDNFTELTARKKQYEYYRDSLFTFGEEVEWKILGDVLKIKNGRDYKCFKEGNIPVYGSGGIMTYINTYVLDKPSVLIPRKGSIDKLYFVDAPFWTVDTIFYTDIYTEIVIPKFVYYFLQKEHLEKYNTAGGVPSLTQAVLNKLPFPVPPLDEQQRIVDILDRFDTLCNDISSGLPAEIKARQQQYEYYRDKLLDFKNLDIKEA